MSIHARLTPEARRRLEAQRRTSAVSSLLISILIIVLLGLILAFILLPALFVEPPRIVTYNASTPDEEELEEKRVLNQIKREPSAPSSALSKVIASTTPSPTAIPVPDVDVPQPSTEFGNSDDFGDGWGGDGTGGGFGNIPATMRQRCSKADRLQRLAANGGTPQCEEAVLKALRWMQKAQAKDGSWGPRKTAYTALALLAYLGHCETPLSPEFGDTVTSAISYLVNLSMKNNGRMADNRKDKHWPYEHAIATYALCEAYTFCKQLGIMLPKLEQATQSGVQWIIDNQNKSGGWDYHYVEAGGRGGDLSIAAWHMQALKAGYHTELDFRNYRKCVSNGVRYVEQRQNRNGGFGYTGKTPVGSANGHFTLTGAGALCLQQHRSSANSASRKGIAYLDKHARFDWKKGPCNLYEHYYNGQAMMNHGGPQWKKYNALFRDQVLKNQRPDGSWGNPTAPGPAHAGHTIYNTALCTLILEVYYRFLPGTGQRS